MSGLDQLAASFTRVAVLRGHDWQERGERGREGRQAHAPCPGLGDGGAVEGGVPAHTGAESPWPPLSILHNGDSSLRCKMEA